ncbi:MAG: PolC-type DNA polymerase III [Oscillospiraceae bacterium]|nr:PolC-type DNA polymerase III [Oscillospiraceae bacterium]
MKDTISLLDLFPGLELREEIKPLLQQNTLENVDLRPREREVSVSVRSETYLPLPLLAEVEQEIAETYDLRSVKLQPLYAGSLLGSVDEADLVGLLAAQYPPATAILAGCRMETQQNELHLHLKGNGLSDLQPHLYPVECWLSDCFGDHVTIRLHGGKALSAEELFAETQKLREQTIVQLPAVVQTAASKSENGQTKPADADMIFGKPFFQEPTPMRELNLDMFKVCVEGEVFAVNHKELPKAKAWVVSFYMTDHTGSVCVNQYMDEAKAKPILEAIAPPNPKKHKPGSYIRVFGKVSLSKYDGELVIQPFGIKTVSRPVREDKAPEKRVELHLHTRMSAMDALSDPAEVIAQAARWGHQAVAITDHGVTHSFTDALANSKTKVAGTDQPIKILYGCEGYFINDVDIPLNPEENKQYRVCVYGDRDAPLNGEFVAVDVEATGLSPERDRLIEIGAVRMRGDQILDRLKTFVDPEQTLPDKIVELTGITDEMLVGAPSEREAMTRFLEFCGDLPIVAHNANYDMGMLKASSRRLGLVFQPTYVDTLGLAYDLLPQFTKRKLDVLAEYFELPDFAHHRAVDDAITCGLLYDRFSKMLLEQGVDRLQAVNHAAGHRDFGSKPTPKEAKIHHILLFAKNSLGLRNLYRLVSFSNLYYFHTRRGGNGAPVIPKSELMRWREGLIIGSACEAGELFSQIVAGRPWEELKKTAEFYDFLEVQPLANNRFLIENGTVSSDEDLKDFNRTVIRLGEALDKPVCATGDVHFLNPEDEIFRRILLASKGFSDCDRENPLYFRTTDEMLEEFSYLGREKAREIVVTNTNLIADMCDWVRPLPHNLYAPKIENSVEDLKSLVYGKLHRLYGENPPELITKRVETELGDIINCHYDVIYISAQKLVQNSLEHGYLVGSRGSVGSSLVAFLSGITEVNSLPPHYRCPNPACKYTTFEVPAGCKCGADLPDAVCPKCGAKFEKDGFAIPFETFLGFGGDKVPDIDLNFSGEYQARAHAYCVEMFGKSHVFRAGTIGDVADKTAFGYVKKYLSERGKTFSRAEETRLAMGCVGVKRTSGQHPGGLVVIPQENQIWDFCPVQHPADDHESEWITTHYDYHPMEENLLKLDMLGHDDPTMIRMLQDMTGVDPQKIPLDDKDTMSIFTSSKVLGYEDDPILGETGAVAIPEFGTGFTRGMLKETQPTQFDVLIRLSGFSHGTDVWLGNARDLILSKTATVGQAIGCRDDIMNYLISCGMPDKRSFKIMEAVRKGRGLPDGAEEEMKAAGVPDWYIGSCKKIKYLFPKAHAAAYVMMAFRIAWFKVHEPLAFYAAYFYRRSQKGGFDAEMMCQGKEKTLETLKALQAAENRTDKDDQLLTTLEVVYEFYLRGFEFLPVSIYASDALKFIPKDGKLLPPFVAISGLGENAAKDIAEGRKGKKFISIEEFSAACPKVSQAHVDALQAAGAFGKLPRTSQVSLFEL